jgi:hypothetical protein
MRDKGTPRWPHQDVGAVWIEFKRAVSKSVDPWSLVTPLQRQTMRRLANNGERVMLAVFWPNKTLSLYYQFAEDPAADDDTMRSSHKDIGAFLAEECGW